MESLSAPAPCPSGTDTCWARSNRLSTLAVVRPVGSCAAVASVADSRLAAADSNSYWSRSSSPSVVVDAFANRADSVDVRSS